MVCITNCYFILISSMDGTVAVPKKKKKLQMIFSKALWPTLTRFCAAIFLRKLVANYGCCSNQKCSKTGNGKLIKDVYPSFDQLHGIWKVVLRHSGKA